LSLGPAGVPWLYAAIRSNVAGFQAIRVPARFAVLVVFGLAVLAGFGTRRATENRAKAGPAARVVCSQCGRVRGHSGVTRIADSRRRRASAGAHPAGAWLAQQNAEQGALLSICLCIPITATPRQCWRLWSIADRS
jgi:hypothetical protein